MFILTLRTDKPAAEIGLYENNQQLVYEVWLAHRQLAETLHVKIKEQLEKVGKDFHDLNGIAVFQGPGSFTGLRIGITVANALAYSLGIPISEAMGEDWRERALARLLNGENDKLVLPEYGALPHITAQKK